MKSPSSRSRRELLKALGGAAAALPLLNATAARAAEPAFPRRLIVVSWPNGAYRSRFFPRNDNGPLAIDAAGGLAIAPLAPYAARMLMVGGLALRNQLDSGSTNGHQSTPFVLTGVRGAPFRGTWDGFKKTAGGPSLDQHVAQQLRRMGVTTQFPSLVTRVEYYKGNDGYISIAGPPVGDEVNAVAPEHLPAKLFEKVFAGATGPMTAPEVVQRQAAGKSVLDYLRRNLERVRGGLPTEDRAKLEAHLDGVRELERRAMTAGNAPGTCAAPGAAPNAVTDRQKIIELHSDIATAALACDLTRVVSLNWASATYKFTFPGGRAAEGGGTEEHGIAHDQYGDGGQTRTKVDRWFCERLAHLLGKLDAVKEGGGTLLDHTVVLFANQMGDGAHHSVEDLPWLVAGDRTAFAMGRVIRYAGAGPKTRESHTRLLVGMCNALGVNPAGFADPSYGDELPGLRG